MSENAANNESLGTSPQSTEGDEHSLLDLVIVLAKHKTLVVGLPLIAAVVAAGLSFRLQYIYTGVTRILPPQQNQPTASLMLNQLGALAAVAGQSLGIKNPNDLYVGMLKSRTVADNLIQRFDLNTYYGEKRQSETRRGLESRTIIASGKDGMIVIEVEDKDPKFAAALANAYVDELTKLTKVLAVTEASRRRLFMETQLAQAKDNLTTAEIAARQGLEKGGLSQAEARGRGLVEVTARLRAQISVKEVQIGTMRTFAAEGNPGLQLAQQELEALKRELSRNEGTSASAANVGGNKVGTSGLDNLGRLRDVKYYEFLYEFLAKQYELAKMDEAKDASIIQVLDIAIEPDFRTRPKRTQFVLIWFVAAGFVAIILAFLLEARERARQDPERVRRWQVLRAYLRIRRAT